MTTTATLTGVHVEKNSSKKQTGRWEAVWVKHTAKGMSVFHQPGVGVVDRHDVEGSKAAAKAYAEANPPTFALS